MHTIVSIDPGSAGKGNACAAFVDGVLIEAWFERVPTFDRAPEPRPQAIVERWERAGRIDVVVIEALASRGAGDGAKSATLVQLAWDGALLAGTFAGRDGCPIVALPPSDTRDVRCAQHGTRAAQAGAMRRECTCRRGWKGGEPKPANHWRGWRVLSEAERAVLGGDATGAHIAAAREKGALSRWSKPGAAYYPRGWDTHNKLCATLLGLTYLGRIKRVA